MKQVSFKCINSTCSHQGVSAFFATTNRAYEHLLSTLLLPCVFCVQLDEEWLNLTSMLGSKQHENEHQVLIAKYRKILNVHFKAQTFPRSITNDRRSSCVEMIANFFMN